MAQPLIPLYILGILQRYGPQHGYQIKKVIGEQLSDFTQIKLPAIYYHLEKMQKEGLLEAGNEKPDSRPEKTIYSVTNKGVEYFMQILVNLLEFDYRPSFSSDGVFFFSDYLQVDMITEKLEIYIEKLQTILQSLQKHWDETVQFVPPEMRTMVDVIFSHHMKHYKAELDWAAETLQSLK
ncbi:MAG: PadR family transcriptional regulator [Clostridiales bacterium]|jgi:DNA-binding PadR family transcriptional regulator|nr:PadR family transcriptional regulator [Clostridiales bacterium]